MNRPEMKLSLTTKMTLAVSLLVAGLLFVTAVGGYLYFAASFKDTIKGQQQALTAVMAAHLTEKAEAASRSLTLVAHDIPLADLGRPERLERFLAEEHDARTVFDAGLLVADRQGRVIASRASLIGHDKLPPDLTACLGTVLATGRPAISSPYVIAGQPPRPVITFAVPILTPDGEAAAVLAGTQLLLNTREVGSVATVRFGKTGYLYLVDRNRTLVVHPERARILERIPVGMNAGIDRAMEGFEGAMEVTNSRGVRGLAVFRSVKGTDWLVVSHFPVKEAYALLVNARWYAAGALLLVVAVTTAVIWLLMRRLTSPLQAVIRHLEQLSSRSGEERLISVRSSDEIGVMVETFNRMVLELDSSKEQLQSSAELYRIVTEFSAEMAIWETPEGTVRYISPNCRSITGYSDKEFLSIPSLFQQIVFTADQAAWRQHADGLHADRKERPPVDVRIVTKEGRVRWISHSCHRIYGPTGEYLGVRGSYRDITERMAAEDGLRKLSLAVEQNPCSILITNLAGTIEYVNPRFCELTGYRAEEAVGRHTRMLKSEAHSDDLYRDLWSTISRGGEWRGEFQNRTKDGRLYWVQASICPIRSAGGETTHYIAIQEEITSRKQAEAALRKSKAELLIKHEQLMILYAQVDMGKKQWEQTLDCISDGVLLVDRAGLVVRCNKAIAELSGKPATSVRGAAWQELVLGEDVDDSGFDGDNGELFNRAQGRWFLVRTYAYGDSAGSGKVITLHDTTERKRASAELEKAYNELKATQARILQQEKMASIGQLAAGVAHEINNPIGFVSSNLGSLGKYLVRVLDYITFEKDRVADRALEELERELADRRRELKIDYIMDDAQQLIRESLEGTERVRQIVQNLKSFSRVDEAEFKFAQINECLESTLNIVWNELKYKAAVNRDYGELPPTKCYPQQLNQVFMNLLVNAAHAIEKQGTIAVRSWRDDAWIYVSVQDSGKGIPEEIRERIFEPFFTTKEVGKGTGLGLSISYDIVKKHGGDIQVTSEPGKGSTFLVQIPLMEDV